MELTRIKNLNEKEKSVVQNLNYQRWRRKMEEQYGTKMNASQNPIVNVDDVKIRRIGEKHPQIREGNFDTDITTIDHAGISDSYNNDLYAKHYYSVIR